MSRTVRLFALAAAGMFCLVPFALSQNEGQGEGTATVTILPKDSHTSSPDISQQTIHVEVNGKQSQITSWQPLRGAQARVEVVLLIDSGARTSLGRELEDIRQFIQSLPPNAKVALASMENGRAVLAGPLSSDRAKVIEQIHLPAGIPGQSASPYFCLSDLAKRWPSNDPAARREVIMITDGVDYYHPQYDPDDPYVQTAIRDSIRAHLVVSSIYWRSAGRFDRTWYANNSGQSLLQQVTSATGGNSYWIGMGNPVSLSPYFDDFNRRLRNQYELGFTAPTSGRPEMANLKIKINAHNVKVTSPEKTWLAPGQMAQR
ncbi:MAG TPA: hypothetical protein VHE33_11630 [Acidobacteriaceae bacterium]|nr:hypothetical protein [Acidobacteriaceae bacterium]